MTSRTPQAVRTAPLRQARVLPPVMAFHETPDGVMYAQSPVALGTYPARLTDCLDRWAAQAGDRTLFAERGADGDWQRLTYRAALDRSRTIAQALVDRRLSADRPVVILSGHGITHALVALASMYAGIPYAPLAPAYSQVSRDLSALQFLLDRLRPGLVFADDGPSFERALTIAGRHGAEVVTVDGADPRWTPLPALEAAVPGRTLDDAHARVTPETIAKILFTSGSTGRPKGVINTHRMLCANQEQLRTVMAFLADEPPVLCDWLPWNHTFGGNHNFGITLYNGGTMYLDSGQPVPALFDRTLDNLREIATTAYFNVPRGFELLLPALRSDEAFRRHFFSRLQILFYAAAGLRQEVADAFDELAVETCGERIPWVTGLGATESAPFAMCTGAQPEATSHIGVPVPGLALKVARVGERREARWKGPNVTPGYWREDELTRAAFDEEGYYRTGDAVDLVAAGDPGAGFVFQGRIAEDFKLSTGTFVRVGPLRARLLRALGDLAQDVVITGHNRNWLGVLIFPNRQVWVAGGRDLVSLVVERLAADAAAHPASSTAIRRALVLDTPPSFDAREITDKGSINQRAVLTNRADLVEALYEDTPPDGVLVIGPEDPRA